MKKILRKTRFIIVSPDQKSGGSIALHALCQNLSKLGYNSKIIYFNTFEYKGRNSSWLLHEFKYRMTFNIKHTIKNILVKSRMTSNKKWIKDCKAYGSAIKDCSEKITPFIRKNDIVIYPEVIFGNPLNASKVVRWLLYHYKFKEMEGTAYNSTDLFISYRDVFNCKELNPNNYRATVAYFNLDFYKMINIGKREGTCFIVRKGRNRDDLPKIFNGLVIDDMDETKKVECFNKCMYCISYDTQTAYSTIAAICGCISIVVPEPGKTIADYCSLDEKHYGVAYGFDQEQMEYAKKTRHMARQSYEEQNRKSIEETKRFAKLCIDYYNLN